ATGDNSGTRSGGAQKHHTGCRLTLNRVRDAVADARNAEEVLLRLLDALRDRRGDLAGFAVADTHESGAITHDNECREAEAPTALDDFRDAVDRHDALQELALVAVAAPALLVGVALPAAAAVLALAGLVGLSRSL